MHGLADRLPVVADEQPALVGTTLNPSPLSHPKYRPDIDGLRAIAVILVLGFHAFPSRITGGFIGVDVFFVISGFLISDIIFESLRKGTFTYYEFQRRRIRRIFPALLLVLATTLLAGWFVLLAPEYLGLGKHVAASAVFVPNFALWGEAGYFDRAAELKPLLHLWSLGIEEQFYIFWPPLVGVFWSKGFKLPKLLIVIGALSFCINILFTYSAPTAAFYSPLSRFWELMIGAGLAYLSSHRPLFTTLIAQNAASILGLGLVVCSTFYLSEQKAFPGWWALAPTFGSALIISAGQRAWLNRHVLNIVPMVWIGKISYPLYLWHWPLISFAWILGDGMPSPLLRVVLLIASFILASGTYLFVERPIQRDLAARVRVYHLCGAMAVIGILGAVLYFGKGMPFRTINGNPAGFEYNFEANAKFQQCFLNEHEPLPFKPICDGGGVETKPLVLIWGDSHAQALSLGLPAQSSLYGFDVAQFTASACPPLIGFDVAARPHCRLINEAVAEKIKTLKPRTVILSAFWYLYNGYSGYSSLDYDKLRATIVYLRQQSVQNIILVGELPTFLIDEPKVGNRVFVSGKTDRTFYRFNYESAAVDRRIREFANQNGVTFLSPLDLLCNDEGCLISASRDKQVPLAWDYGHLTTAGANLVFESAIKKKLISLP